LLLAEHQQHMLLVISANGRLEGIVTKSDILKALEVRRDPNDLQGAYGNNAVKRLLRRQ
jgi:CBS-domain-containing membrane protein